MANFPDDDEMDHLSRKAANKYDPKIPIRGTGWEKIKQQLDIDLLRKRKPLAVRRIVMYAIPALFVLVSLSYLIVQQFPQHLSKRQTSSLPVADTSTSPPGPPRAVLKEISPLPKCDNINKSQKNSYSSNYTFEIKPVLTEKIASQDHRHPGLAGLDRSDDDIFAADSSTVWSADLPLALEKSKSLPRQRHGLRYASIISMRAGLFSNHADRHSFDSILKALVATKKLSKESTGARKNKDLLEPGTGRLQFGLDIGPDFTLVGSHTKPRGGVLFGLTANYTVKQRWSLAIGVLKIHKNYIATGQDFALHNNSWLTTMPNGKLEHVEGTMDMIEIPLAIRYHVHVAGKNLFYLSAGLSSYLIEKENCDYYIKTFVYQRKEHWL
ncbi:hypothetical protein ACQ86N_22775 [Puia sp. P3]|uniref:hypothetical protein n=1 Tax=Puia sp. P3 TaxID=3423952 RepID=UPI003D669F37